MLTHKFRVGVPPTEDTKITAAARSIYFKGCLRLVFTGLKDENYFYF